MCFKRCCQRISYPESGRSRPALLRADVAHFARTDPQVGHSRGRPASWSNRARKRRAGGAKDLGKHRTRINREWGIEGGRYCRGHARLDRQDLTLASERRRCEPHWHLTKTVTRLRPAVAGLRRGKASE